MSSAANTVCVTGWTDAEKLMFISALWMAREPAAFFQFMPAMAPQWDEGAALRDLKSGYIDYTSGRCIKISTRSDEWDLHLYDRDVPAGGKYGKQIYDEVHAKIVAARG